MKQLLIENIRNCRKKFGKTAKETYKAIYKLVKEYPYYPNYEQDWLAKNGHNL